MSDDRGGIEPISEPRVFDNPEVVLLREIRILLRSIDRKLTIQADEWVICPACGGRGERNHPNSRGDNYWLPCHQCAKLGRVRKETTDA